MGFINAHFQVYTNKVYETMVEAQGAIINIFDKLYRMLLIEPTQRPNQQQHYPLGNAIDWNEAPWQQRFTDIDLFQSIVAQHVIVHPAYESYQLNHNAIFGKHNTSTPRRRKTRYTTTSTRTIHAHKTTIIDRATTTTK